MSLNQDQISAEQLGFVRSDGDIGFTRNSDGTRWRERLLYNCGYGQPKGFERLPSLDFDQLIYIALTYKKSLSTLPESDKKQNALGSVAIIMEDHLDEFIDFLSVHIDNDDLYDNDVYRENLKLFCIDETNSIGVGGLGKFSYENYLNTKIKWLTISRKTKGKIYR